MLENSFYTVPAAGGVPRLLWYAIGSGFDYHFRNRKIYWVRQNTGQVGQRNLCSVPQNL